MIGLRRAKLTVIEQRVGRRRSTVGQQIFNIQEKDPHHGEKKHQTFIEKSVGPPGAN